MRKAMCFIVGLALLTACGGGGGGGGGLPVTVTVGARGLEGGSVRVEGTGQVCAGDSCQVDAVTGGTLRLTAEPAAGAVFTGWSGDCTGTGVCELRVQHDEHRVVAGFGVMGAWSRSIGSPESDSVHAVARAADGGITLVGSVGAAVTVDGTRIEAGSFLAQLDEVGRLRWHLPLPALSGKVRLALLPGGDVAVAGTFGGTVTVGGVGLTSAGLGDVLVARVSGAGEVRWARRFGGTGSEEALLLDVDPQGELHVGGNTEGFQPEGSSTPVYSRGFVLELAGDGALLGTSPEWEGPSFLRFDGAGRRTLVGEDTTTFTLWASSTDPGGNLAWAYEPREPTAARVIPASVHVLADDSTLVAGHFTGYMGDVTADPSGAMDVFLLRLSATGQVTLARRLGGRDADTLACLERGVGGSLVLAGSTGGTGIDLGAGERTIGFGRGDEVFLARLDADGAHLWSTTFGGSASDRARACAASAAGVIVAGTFEETVHFGDAERTHAGRGDIFLLHLP